MDGEYSKEESSYRCVRRFPLQASGPSLCRPQGHLWRNLSEMTKRCLQAVPWRGSDTAIHPPVIAYHWLKGCLYWEKLCRQRCHEAGLTGVRWTKSTLKSKLPGKPTVPHKLGWLVTLPGA